MTDIEICIDVPSLEDGVRFYGEVFGFPVVSRPWPHVACLQAGPVVIALMEKAAGTSPSSNAAGSRDYARHWTPVHLDFRVDDIEATLARAEAAGARRESGIIEEATQTLVVLSDPFGHGFCLLGPPADAA